MPLANVVGTRQGVFLIENLLAVFRISQKPTARTLSIRPCVGRFDNTNVSAAVKAQEDATGLATGIGTRCPFDKIKHVGPNAQFRALLVFFTYQFG
jgi:hypothetical protein